MMKQRNVGVDIAKALGIMMVVACHANFAPASPFRFFHMALFFFLTGWLSTFESRFGSFVLAKIKHLYVPFVVCELAFLLLHYLLPIETGLFVASSMPLWEQLVRIVCFDNVEIMLSPLWFLPALFFVNLLCYGLIRLWRNRPWLLFGISLLLMVVGLACGHHSWLQVPSLGFSNGVGVVLVAQFFCMGGYLLKRIDFRFDKWYLALIGLCYLYAAKLWLGLSVDMRVNQYSHVALWLLSVCAGVYLTMWLAERLAAIRGGQSVTARALAFTGRQSLLILMLHIFCFKLVGLIQVHCLNYDPSRLPLWGNLSDVWYWTLAYTAAGVLIPLVPALIFTLFAGFKQEF